MGVVAWALIVVVVLLGVRWLYERSPKRRQRSRFRALLVACKGDQDLMERLIFNELRRHEGIDYAEAARRALARLARDQR